MFGYTFPDTRPLRKGSVFLPEADDVCASVGSPGSAAQEVQAGLGAESKDWAAGCPCSRLSPTPRGAGCPHLCAFLESPGRRGSGLSLGAHCLRLAPIPGAPPTPGRHLLCQQLCVSQQWRSQREFPAQTQMAGACDAGSILTLIRMLFPNPYVRFCVLPAASPMGSRLCSLP